MLVNMHDILCEWLDHLNCPRHLRPAPQAKLFPNAIELSGWRHYVDNLIRRGLAGLTFIPRFLEEVKSLVSFCRDHSMVQEFEASLRRRGLNALADAIVALSLPKFADWRWHTLHEVMDTLIELIPSLQQAWDAQLFANARDTTRLQHITRGFLRASFLPEALFVTWYCELLDNMMSWIGFCDCHAEGEGRQCWRRGRRLKHAYAYVRDTLSEALEEARRWTAASWDGFEWLLHEAQATIRYIYVLGLQNVAYMEQLPWLLVRLDEPGVLQRCIHQWNSTPRDAHHNVSNFFMDPEHVGGIWSDVQNIDAMGGNCSARVKQAIRTLENIPMDDIHGESPHARAHHIFSHAPGGRFAWTASSARLVQNLGHLDELAGATGACLQSEWNRWSRVILE